MKVAAIGLAILGLAVAGSAAASSRVTDVDYLRANRCKGLAVGMGADAAGFTSFIKTEGVSRLDVILQRGDEEFTRAKRQAANANLKDKLAAELNGPCAAYMTGSGQAMAGGASAATAAH
ncbi:MAG: hypothetical protein E7812_10930 [Phenylobacterium sp.]|nr:MAG: hypothetical protein E7812_10930 [Phenylobacterium sp.]